jgi:hypothetical protein
MAHQSESNFYHRFTLYWSIEAVVAQRTHSGTSLQSFPAKGDRFWNQQNYPWTLVRLLPNAQHYTVGRFYSRTEAENHKRFLGKWMPAAEFEVIFDEKTVTADN